MCLTFEPPCPNVMRPTSPRSIPARWQGCGAYFYIVSLTLYMCNIASHIWLYFIHLWQDDKFLKDIKKKSLTYNKIPCSWNPWSKLNKSTFYYLCLLHYINYIVNMKTDPSYTFQHSLLTREVFIMVHGHSQSEESHKKNLIGNPSVIATYYLALSHRKAFTNNSISPRF